MRIIVLASSSFSLKPENGESMVLINFGLQLQDYRALHNRT